MKAIILAAGVGKRLREHSDDPKCLLRIGGESLLRRYLRMLNACGIEDVVLVAGYRHERLREEIAGSGFEGKVRMVINHDFTEGSIISLWCARHELTGEVLVMDADIYFEEDLMQKAFSSTKRDFFLLDTTSVNDGEAVMVGFDGERAVAQARGLKGNYSVLGEMVGISRLSAELSQAMAALLERRVKEGERSMGYEFLFAELFNSWPISYELVDGIKWVEIDFPEDVSRAIHLANRT